MRRNPASLICRASLGAALLVLGCGSDSGSNGGGESSTGVALEPRLSAIEERVFALSCAFASCHGGDDPEEGLLLEGATHARLVNQPSSQVAGRMRVVPGDPAASYLFEKISADQPAEGERMPAANPPLADAAVEAIRAWIEAGAPDD